VLPIGERKGNAFEHRTAEVGARRRVREAEEHALGVRIIVRRALAGQVRQEDDPRITVGGSDLGQQRRFAGGAGKRGHPR